MTRWAVIGGSGFVGRAIVAAIEDRGDAVHVVPAPRLQCAARSLAGVAAAASVEHAAVSALAAALRGNDVVVNAAGAAAPDSPESDELFGANALLPLVVGQAAQQAGCARYVHVSSQSVLGDVPVLTERPVWHPFSPYSASKALGEQVLLAERPELDLVIFRALSVQGAGRGTTERLVSVARSRLAAVAVDAPTPLTHIDSTAAAIVFCGAHASVPPTVVLQRDDGLTTRSALEALGASRVRRVPRFVAGPGVAALRFAGRFSERFLGLSRRADLLLYGRQSRADWMTEQNFDARADTAAWRALGDAVAAGPAGGDRDS